MTSLHRFWAALGPKRHAYAAGGLFFLGVLLRALLLNATTSDTQQFVLPWFDRLARAGYAALGQALPNKVGTDANYTPPYYYLLYLASLLDGAAPRLWLIKFVSIAFDALAAAFAYRAVRLNFSHTRALYASAALFAAPTVILNGAWWGQCDIIWVSLILGSFSFAMARRPLWAVILFGVALSFKAQAFFLAPFLFLLFLRGEMSVWRLALVPFVYAAMMVPAVALGQSWGDVFSVYAHQAGHFKQLSLSAPNPYYFISDDFYAPGVAIGLTVTTLACAALAFLARKADLRPADRTLAAAMFVALSVLLLPKMHDRYFFAADVFSIVLAFYVPRLWFAAASFQITSLFAYVPNITFSLNGAAWTDPLPTAAMLNTAIVAYLVYSYWRVCTRPGDEIGVHGLRPLSVAAATIVIGNALWLALTYTLAALAARYCPTGGLMNLAVCSRDLPANVIYGTWRHYLMYALMFAPAYAAARLAMARAWGAARRA
jgi:Gpi18-like mannosyltransferase